MIQNVSALAHGGYRADFSTKKDAPAHSDALRHNGEQGRGFAFGHNKAGRVEDAPSSAPVDVVETGGVAAVPAESAGVPTYGGAPAPVAGGDGNATAVTKDGSFDITVALAPEGAKNTGKGVADIEDGGHYLLTLGSHPGAKYRVVGVEGGEGVTNPNNLKGTIYLKDGVELASGADAAPETKPVSDKVAEFLSKRDDILAAPEKENSGKKVRHGITREDLDRFNLLSTPEEQVLNILDDRFDKAKFTSKEKVSLRVALGLAEQLQKPAPTEEPEATPDERGLKRGHFKKGLSSYGTGLDLAATRRQGPFGFFA